jgi:serine phosphatase RsbU (regulator of sigma subunit)
VTETAILSLLIATENSDLVTRVEQTGFPVTSTRDGFDAIRLAIESHPDVIILDEQLDNLPGPTIALYFRINPLTASIPIIDLSLAKGDIWKELKSNSTIPDILSEILIQEVTKCREIAFPFKNNKSAFESKIHSTEPLSVALNIIDCYRQRLDLSNTMMEMAAIQRDVSDFEYSVRKVMDTAAGALQCKLLSLTVLNDFTQYVLIRDSSLSANQLEDLDKENHRLMVELLNQPVAIDQKLVFGRRKLAKITADDSNSKNYFSCPVTLNDSTIGFLTGLCPNNEKHAQLIMSFLPDLAIQIGLLLHNAELLRDREQLVSEMAAILRAVLETSSLSPLAETQSENSLLQYLLIVLEMCHTERGCIFLFDKATGMVTTSASLGCNVNELLLEPFRDSASLSECIQKMAPKEVCIDTDSGGSVRSGRMLVPLSVGETIMGGLVILGISGVYDFRIIQAIKTLAGMGGYFIYNTTLYKQTIKNSIIEDQLNLAREIQRDMLPNAHPDLKGFDIFGRSQPARQVGGDFFDYLAIDKKRFQIAIADVSGKGIPASLLMTMTRALVIAASEKTEGPEEVLRDVNLHLVNRISFGQFVTASLLTFADDKVIFASAGHSPLMIYRVATGEFEDISAEGVAMGIIDTLDFGNVELELHPGDVGLMYTDGLNEAMNHKNEQFGYDRIREVVKRHATCSSEEIVAALFHAIEEHASGADQSDDTTIVAIKKLNIEENKDGSNEDQKQIDKKYNPVSLSTKAKTENINQETASNNGGRIPFRADPTSDCFALRAFSKRPGGVLPKPRQAGAVSGRRNRLWDRRQDFE